MTEQIKFKSQADIQRWLLEKPGRRVQHIQYKTVVGYNDDGLLWDFTNELIASHFLYPEYWQPVPDPAPWHEHPEAVGALLWVMDSKDDGRFFRVCKEMCEGKFTKLLGADWRYARPCTPDEVREFLRKAEILAQLPQPGEG